MTAITTMIPRTSIPSCLTAAPLPLGIAGRHDSHTRSPHLLQLGFHLGVQPLVFYGKASSRSRSDDQAWVVVKGGIMNQSGQRTRLAFDHRDCPVGADRWQLDELPTSVDEILLCGTPEDEPKGGIAKRSSQCLTEFPGRKRLR